MIPLTVVRGVRAALLLTALLALPLSLAAQTDSAEVDTAASIPAGTVSDSVPATVAGEEDSTPVADDTAFARRVNEIVDARGPAGLPGPWGWALFVAAMFGALGGLAGDIVTDGGRLEAWRRDGTVWMIGFPGNLLVGAVAAVILVGMRPPGGDWGVLVGTALAVGVASEAFLKSIIAGFESKEAKRRAEAMSVATIEIVRAHAERRPRGSAEILNLDAIDDARRMNPASTGPDAAKPMPPAAHDAAAFEKSIRAVAEKLGFDVT